MVTLWSEIPMDILRSVFERLSFVDFHRAKIVCSNWYSCSKQSLLRKNGSPWLILFPEDGGACALYNHEEARVYKTKRDLSRFRFLANSGNWFLVLDSRSNLYIIDLFSKKTINLPPLDSFKGDKYNLKRVGEKKFKEVGTYTSCVIQNAKNLRGLLWVDEKKEEYVVVWYFGDKNMIDYLVFCKNGEDHYHEIPIYFGVSDMVLTSCGDSLYILTTGDYITKLDLPGQEGFKDVSKNGDMLLRFHCPCPPRDFKLTYDAKGSYNFAVTSSGEVLLVMNIFSESTRHRIFFLYKDPNLGPRESTYNKLVEVDSLGNEALLLDLGITVPADRDLGIEPNSIYFTRHDRFRYQKRSCPDICVFNLETKTLKRFPGLSNLKLTDARWFLMS